MFQWVVPHEVKTSWIHQDGEHRLYLEGVEVVQNAGLAAHYETRFRHYWYRNPPRLRKDKYEEYAQAWAKKALDYKIIGGQGSPPPLGLLSGIHRKVPKDISDKHKDFHAKIKTSRPQLKRK